MSAMVTAHVSEAELACHDGPGHTPGTPYPFDEVDEDDLLRRPWRETRALPLCETFETIREAAGGEPMEIDSGYRTPAYDQKLYDDDRGAGNVAKPQSSQHPKGRAMDVKHKHLTPRALFTLILGLYQAGQLPHLGGVGLYPTFVHIDVRSRGVGDHLAIWGGTRLANII